ncbi:MAG: hypothetical protein K9N23_03240 [Akkermansiaceae bacterium]|nr:hypothetical protein [Akkermansiaceae bacterium]MCF7730670.1 hypothetical protein [Akkermansiaceae bacterium]
MIGCHWIAGLEYAVDGSTRMTLADCAYGKAEGGVSRGDLAQGPPPALHGGPADLGDRPGSAAPVSGLRQVFLFGVSKPAAGG